MSTIGANTFTAIYTTLPDARCLIKDERGREINEAVSVGLQEQRDYDDRGTAVSYIGNVRYKETSEPEPIGVGDVIEIKLAEDDDFREVRVSSRTVSGGAVRLDIESEFER